MTVAIDNIPTMDTEYISEEGRTVTRTNLGYYIRYENPSVERAEDGFIIDGERFRGLSDE
jgi:hypothetical protein